jgi:catechol 2,3-dioxygenase-like lactoylglutathione lyase family enzyme
MSMQIPVAGVHHITLVGSNPKDTIAFYQGVLGMPLSDGCLAVAGSAWRTAGPALGAQWDGRSGTAWAACARGGCGCVATPAGAGCARSPERRPLGLGGRVRKAPHTPYRP